MIILSRKKVKTFIDNVLHLHSRFFKLNIYTYITFLAHMVIYFTTNVINVCPPCKFTIYINLVEKALF